jgi:hypothetical protein
MAPALGGWCRWTHRSAGEVWGASADRFLAGGRKQGGGALGGSPSERERGGGGRGNQGPTWRVPHWGRSEGGVPHGGHEGRDPAPTGRRCPRITVFDRLGYKSSSSGHVVSKKSLFDRVQFDLGKRHQGMRNVPLPRESSFHRLDFGDQNFRCASDAKSKGIQTSRGNSTNSSGNIDHHERRNGQVQISKSMGLKETMGQPKFCVHCLRACLFPAFHHFSY